MYFRPGDWRIAIPEVLLFGPNGRRGSEGTLRGGRVERGWRVPPSRKFLCREKVALILLPRDPLSGASPQRFCPHPPSSQFADGLLPSSLVTLLVFCFAGALPNLSYPRSPLHPMQCAIVEAGCRDSSSRFFCIVIEPSPHVPAFCDFQSMLVKLVDYLPSLQALQPISTSQRV